MLGSSLVQLSKHMPSAGGYYTYVSRAIHPRAGFLTPWMYVFYSPFAGGSIYSMASSASSSQASSGPTTASTCPGCGGRASWWACRSSPSFKRGIQISVRAMLVLGGLEMVIVFVLMIWGFFDPGPGGTVFAVF